MGNLLYQQQFLCWFFMFAPCNDMDSRNTIAMWKFIGLMDNIKKFTYPWNNLTLTDVDRNKGMNQSLTRPHLKRVKHTCRQRQLIGVPKHKALECCRLQWWVCSTVPHCIYDVSENISDWFAPYSVIFSDLVLQNTGGQPVHVDYKGPSHGS